MEMHVTVASGNETLLNLVRDFALGLGCTAEPAPPSAIAVTHPAAPQGESNLLSLLTYVALSAARTGVDSSEPLCQVRYRQASTTSEVTLGLRIADFALKG